MMSRKLDGFGGYHTTIKRSLCDCCGTNEPKYRYYSVKMCDDCFAKAQDKREGFYDYNKFIQNLDMCDCCKTINTQLRSYNICESCWVKVRERWGH